MLCDHCRGEFPVVEVRHRTNDFDITPGVAPGALHILKKSPIRRKKAGLINPVAKEGPGQEKGEWIDKTIALRCPQASAQKMGLNPAPEGIYTFSWIDWLSA